MTETEHGGRPPAKVDANAVFNIQYFFHYYRAPLEKELLCIS
jgi:hypothetical protein